MRGIRLEQDSIFKSFSDCFKITLGIFNVLRETLPFRSKIFSINNYLPVNDLVNHLEVESICAAVASQRHKEIIFWVLVSKTDS